VYLTYTHKNSTNKSKKEDFTMSLLEGKKVIIIGDRDGIPGDAIAECATSAGAEVIYSSTECFV
jgi:betaine reductase